MKERKRVQVYFSDESLTHSYFAEDCDINVIMAQYEKSGLIEHVNRYNGSYGDFTDVSDYQSSLNAVLEAQEAFDSLPAKVRSRFSNDPAEFLSFVNDSSNKDEMISLGLLKSVDVVDSGDVASESEPAYTPT
jgi:phage internal scaffolding protein